MESSKRDDSLPHNTMDVSDLRRSATGPALERADFTGLEVPDRYVFGCGMDYKGQLRHLRGIYAVKGL